MRRASRGACFMSGWVACVALACALVFVAGVGPAHAAEAAQRSCGARAATSAPADAARNAPSEAHISLNTSSGAIGTQLVVSGANWPARVNITITMQFTIDHNGDYPVTSDALASVATSASGAFMTGTIQIPTGPCNSVPIPGSISQVISSTSNGAITASAPIKMVVSPGLNLDNTQGELHRDATTVPVSGVSWIPGVKVTITLARYADPSQGSSSPPASLPGAQSLVAVADAAGGFKLDLPVPAGLPLGAALTATAQANAPEYGTLTIYAYSVLTVIAPLAGDISVKPKQGLPGAAIFITGSHWQPNERLNIGGCLVPSAKDDGIPYCGPGVFYLAVLGNVFTDAEGAFATKALIPDNWALDHAATIIVYPDESTSASTFVRATYFVGAVSPGATPSTTVTDPDTISSAQPANFTWMTLAIGLGALLTAAFVFWPRLSARWRYGAPDATPIDMARTFPEGGEDGERPTD